MPPSAYFGRGYLGLVEEDKEPVPASQKKMTRDMVRLAGTDLDLQPQTPDFEGQSPAKAFSKDKMMLRWQEEARQRAVFVLERREDRWQPAAGGVVIASGEGDGDECECECRGFP